MQGVSDRTWRPVDAFDDFQPRTKDSPEQLRDAAEKFEALLVAQMLRCARQAGEEVGNAGDNSIREIAEDKLAESITACGGLGLVNVILDQVKGSNFGSSQGGGASSARA